MFSSRKSSIRFSFIAFICAVLLLPACRQDKYVKTEGMIWNTTYHITYAGNPSLTDSILSVLDEVGRSLNVFDTTSLVSKANLADTIIIDTHFRNVYNASRQINKASHGMFDPTLSPLITAWGFGPGHNISADTLEVKKILEYIGIAKTHLNGDTLIKNDKRINFNFSAVAKGYACDAIADMLKRNEVTNYLVEIGGEIAVGGVSPKMQPWTISIDRPVETDSTEIHDASAIIKITDAGIATSGNYRNFRKEDGKTLGHTLSPVTGRPVTTDVISATVIAPNAMTADATATACMAAGSETSKEMMKVLGYECMLILSDSTIWMTDGLRNLIQK